MAIKSSFRNGSLVLMNPDNGEMMDQEDEDLVKNFSDESIDSDEFDSEFDNRELSDGEMSYDEAELKPLSEIWDQKSDDEHMKEPSIQLDTREEELEELSDSDDESDDESDSEDEEEDDDEDDIFNGSDAEEDEAETDGALSNVMTSLKDLNKNKEEKAKKKLISLNIKENEFNVPVSGSGVGLSLNDMMDVVNDQDTKQKTGLLKNADEIKPVSVPLPQRIQKRNERAAAFELTKKEVSTWKDEVERLKRQEVLDLSKLHPDKVSKLRQTSVFASVTKSLTELESKVNNLLEESLLQDTKKEQMFEQIAVAKMSKEEMLKKQNELRMMRELMFREERKAKRIKKIKSKSYRRIKKKEMLRNKELLEDAEEIDMQDPENDSARAEARMTLKFKNSTNKWAKDMIRHGMTKDRDTRAEMESMLLQGERLKEKILGRGDSDVEENLSDLENEEDDDDEETDAQKANVGKTGFMNMAFMKKAEEKLKEKNKKDLAKLRDLEAGRDIDEFKDVEKAKVVLNKGRKIYTPSAIKTSESMEQVNKEAVEEQLIDESKSLVNKLNQSANKKSNNSGGKSSGNGSNEGKDDTSDTEANPWLSGSSVKKSSKVRVVDETSSQAEKSAYKLGKQKDRGKVKDEIVMIDTGNTLDIKEDDENESGEELGTEIKQFDKSVIEEAFAGDNVVKAFEREKKRVVREEDDQWISAEPLGINSWIGGTEKQRKKQKKNEKLKKVKGVKSANQRTDKNLKNVIFNEKVNKKNLKYQSSAVPFPFESKEQYERSLRMPIGQEWNTRANFQKATMPNVITKSGQVIRPLSRKNK